MNQEGKNEFNTFLAYLNRMSLNELILAYIEAKTGSKQEYDKLPLELIIYIQEIENRIKNYYPEKVLKDIFGENPPEAED